MQLILPYMIGFAMAATAGVLFAGVISFAAGSRFNAKYSSRLMALRVILQGVALALFGLLVMFNIL
jgi:hypothetical protein